MIIVTLHDINSLLIDSKMETEAKKTPLLVAHQDTSGTSFLETSTIARKFCLLFTADGKS